MAKRILVSKELKKELKKVQRNVAKKLQLKAYRYQIRLPKKIGRWRIST